MSTELQILLGSAAIVCAAMFGYQAGWRARNEWGRSNRYRAGEYSNGNCVPLPPAPPYRRDRNPFISEFQQQINDCLSFTEGPVQHKATPETENTSGGYLSACILELRARVELLEATQHAHIDTSRLSDEKRDQIRQDLARPARVFATAEVAPIVMPSPPAGSLVERVAPLIAYFASEGLPGDDATPTARAAILEVATWLREHTRYSVTSTIAADLEYEANR